MAQLIQTWQSLRSSYWFLPTVMSLLAALLSLALTALDRTLGSDWVDAAPGIYLIHAEGARGLLTTVAGSMIGVAGVTFSITIAALSYTTSTLGPRLLTNFMNDRGNQLTLGTFVATFVYCLLLLRTVRGGDDPAEVFVPHLALLAAMALTIASLGVLIYFIHHITESLHVSNVVGNVARDLDRAIDSYGARADAAADNPEAQLPEDFDERAVAIAADGHGYIQNMLDAQLLRLAVQYDLVLRIDRAPGDFVADGQTLLRAWPAERVDDDLVASFTGAYAWGRQRTQAQDILFLVDELVEIAARALSPGINDPYTAMGCLDWLCAGLIRLARRDIGALHRFDDDGRLRLWMPAFNFRTLTLAIFDQLRGYFAADRNAMLHMFDQIGAVGEFIGDTGRRRLLLDQADALREAALANCHNHRDRTAIEQAYLRAERRCEGPAQPASA